MTRLAFILPALLLVACAESPVREAASGPASPRLDLVAVYDRLLELEPCGCSIAPLGGIEREWNARETIAKDTPGTLAWVSIGTTFVPTSDKFDPKREEYYRRKGKYLVEAMNRLGTVALAPSVDDFAFGVDRVREREKDARFPFTSANLYDKRTGKRLFPPFAEVRAGKARAYVIGVSRGSSAGYPKPADVEARDAAAAVGEALAALPEKDALVVLLSTLPPAERDAIHAKYPALRIAIGAEREKGNFVSQPAPGFAYFTPIDRGRTLAHFGLDRIDHVDALQNDDVFGETKLRRGDLVKAIAQVSGQLKKAAKKNRAALEAEKKDLQARLEAANAAPVSAAPGAVRYKFAQVTLDQSYDWQRAAGDENPMSDVLKRYKEAVRELATAGLEEE